MRPLERPQLFFPVMLTCTLGELPLNAKGSSVPQTVTEQ